MKYEKTLCNAYAYGLLNRTVGKSGREMFDEFTLLEQMAIKVG